MPNTVWNVLRENRELDMIYENWDIDFKIWVMWQPNIAQITNFERISNLIIAKTEPQDFITERGKWHDYPNWHAWHKDNDANRWSQHIQTRKH